MKKTTYLSAEGKQKIEEELAILRGPQRLEIARRLKSAIEMGDLSENADYHAAKEDQGFLEGRILELEAMLSAAEVVDATVASDAGVQIGHKVSVLVDNDREDYYFLVGANEANPREKRISYLSPIGAALFHHKVGDTVAASLPSGKVLSIKILRIE